MTRYKAYEVLGVDSNASTEDIKTAYAELSKKYHPEENPKEFQQLHEAYVTLTRYNKTRTRDISNLSMRSFNDNDESIQEDIVVEENVFDFCNVDEARKKEVEGELQKVIIWLDDVMYSDKKLDHVLLKVILNYEKREIIYNTKFIEKLIDVLQESYVDDETKNVVMQYIRPWDTTLDNIREVLNTLQEILEKRNKEYFIKYYLEERQAFLRMIVLVMMPVVLMLPDVHPHRFPAPSNSLPPKAQPQICAARILPDTAPSSPSLLR